MKKINYYLNQLPEPYRSQAISNTDESHLNAFATNLSNALSRAFIWRNTLEGSDYWVYLLNGLEADQFADDHEEEQRFEAGTNWKWESSYTEEDMRDYGIFYLSNQGKGNELLGKDLFEEWVKQHKNK